MQKPNKFFLIGLTAVLIFSLALPQSAWAGLIPGPFDYFDMVSQNTEEVAGPIMGKILTTFIFYVTGLIALNATAHILDKVIVAQSTWVDLQTPMVQEGWHFTAGLANMLLILILIFLAFQVILKIDTVATKKMLIKLFIVALLLNFSILFIEMALDVTDVFYNSILNSVKSMPSSDSLFGAVVDVLTGGKSKIIRNFTVMLGGWLITFLIPGAGAIREFIIGILFVSMYLPLIIGWAIEAIFFFLLSGVFLIFIFVFTARVYIIQFLAILSPLAFVSLILPQTEKYWKEWFNHLVQWVFVGIFLLFFLALWCAGIQGIIPAELDNPWLAAIPFVSWRGVSKQMLFYLITIVYFGILLFVSRRAVPAITNEITGLARNIGATVWSAGVRPLARGIGRGTREVVAESPRLQRLAEKEASLQTPELKGWRRLAKPVVGPLYALRRKTGYTLGPGAVEARRKDIEELEKKLAGQTAAAQMATFRSAKNDIEGTAALRAIIKDNNLREAERDLGLSNTEIASTYYAAKKYDAHKDISSARPDVLSRVITNIAQRYRKQDWEVYKDRIEGEPESGIIGQMKPNRAGLISEKVFTNDDIMKAAIMSWDSRHIAKLYETHGSAGVKAIERAIKGIGGMGQLKKVNPQLHQFIKDTAGRRLGFNL